MTEGVELVLLVENYKVMFLQFVKDNVKEET